MQISEFVYGENYYTHFAMISLATIGVCVFMRSLRWAHFLFYFVGKENEIENQIRRTAKNEQMA